MEDHRLSVRIVEKVHENLIEKVVENLVSRRSAARSLATDD
jgi:hypothetical protein